MRLAVWIVGEPAAGKNTVARKLLGEGRANLKGAITRAERFRDYAVAHGARMVPA